MNTTPFLRPLMMPLSVSLLATSLIMVACSSDPDPIPLQPQLPAIGGSVVKSIKHLGNMTSSYDWDFSYVSGRLVTASGTIRDASGDVDESYSYTSTIGYGPNYIAVSNSSGDATSVTLNTQGYIERMTVNRNIYNFTYTDGRLTAWDKTVFENSFGQAKQYRSSATIEYANGNLSRIVYYAPDNDPVTLTFTPSQLVNYNGLLPETVSEELGCLGFEHLYYAGFLGRPTINMVKSLTVTDSKGQTSYTTDFEYGTRGNDIVLCNYHTPQGGVASASYGY